MRTIVDFNSSRSNPNPNPNPNSNRTNAGNNKDLVNWNVVDDVVMGGQSKGSFGINEEGNGVFKGQVSLANNGGFSSVKYRLDQLETKGFSKLVLCIKGDGKSYQFRVKNQSADRHSFVTTFTTNKEWETITIDLFELAPAFRGNKLDLPNYKGEGFEELALLIANRKEEHFKMEISAIYLKA